MSGFLVVALAAMVGFLVGEGFGLGIQAAFVCGFVAWIALPKRTPPPSRSAPGGTSSVPVIRAFLEEARAKDIIDGPTYQQLSYLLEPKPVGVDHSSQPGAPGVVSRPEPIVVRRPAPTVVSPPGKGRQMWDRLLSDFQLHALAYTGVLLVFVGTLGLVLFAFAGVSSALRPVAEVSIPVVLFGSARFLRPRGAAFVSGSIELLAGLTLPIVLFAAVADDSPFPPDLTGARLVAFVALASLALAFVYNVIGGQPGSTLRFLVAPMLWTAAGALGLMFEAGASSSQMAVVAVSVTVVLGSTFVLRDILPKRQIEVASTPGAAVVYGLTLLLAATESWPAIPALVAGTATVGAVLMLRTRYRDIPPVSVALAAITGTTLLALVPEWGVARIGVLGVAGFAVLLHLEMRSVDRTRIGHLLTGVGLGASIAASLLEPWTGSVAAAVLGIAVVTLPWDERVRWPAAAASFGLSLALALEGLGITAEGRALTWATVSILCALVTRPLFRHAVITTTLGVTAVAASLMTLVHASGNAIFEGAMDKDFGEARLAAAFAVAVGCVVAQHPTARRQWMYWYGWTMVYPALVFAAVAVLFDYTLFHVISMTFGSIAAWGSLGLDDALNSRRSPGELVRAPWLRAGPVVGVVAMAVGLVAASFHSSVELGFSSIAMAAVSLAIAIQLRMGAVSYASYALLSWGAALLLPRSIVDRPWILVAWAGLLTIASFALEKSTSERRLAVRWDLPPLGVAHAAVALALAMATVSGAIVPTFVGAGALSLAVAAWRRHPGWIVAGDVLTVLGAAYAGQSWLALALAFTSAAAIVGSEFLPTFRLPLQICAAGAAAGAWFSFDLWLDLSAEISVTVTATLAFVTALTYLGLENIKSNAWSRALATYACAAAVAANLLAMAEWPRRDLLIVAVLVTGVEAAAAGVAKRNAWALHLSALLLLAAWLLHATEALRGQTEWLTAPAGLTVLVEVEIARWSNRRAGRTPSQPETVALEYVGMGLLILPSLVQAMIESLVYALPVAGLGIVLMVWGALTQVRRRALGGVASVLSAALVVVGVPLAHVLPQVRGVALWLSLAAVGAALIGAATTLERGRVRLAKTMRSIDALMEGWE